MPRVTPDPSLPERLAPITLTDAEGASVRLGDLWAQRPRALIHLRHFGWLFCREQVAQLRDHVPEIRRLGGDLAAIGTGDRSYAAAFAEVEGIDFPLLVDPELASYRAAGARRAGGATFLRPRQALRASAATLRGHRQRTAGLHPLQLGATHVITPGGDVAYAWVNDDFGDHAPVADVVAAVAGRPAA